MPGALLELPVTAHGGLDVARMLYQTAHTRPITGGYLSRAVVNPDLSACGPFGAFAHYLVPGPDIVKAPSPQQLAALLAREQIAFLAVYKSRFSDQENLGALPRSELAAWQDLAGRLGVRMADDPAVTTYRVLPDAAPAAPFVQLGDTWYGLESSGGGPFRALVCWKRSAGQGQLSASALPFVSREAIISSTCRMVRRPDGLRWAR